MHNNSSLPGWIECGYNWTGPVHGTTGFGSTDSQLVGYIGCVIAVLCFGSNFVPLKFVKTGDGIFTQWIMCASIWLVGLVVQLMREQPLFFQLTLLQGALWTIGNCCVIPIINLIGLSLGLLIWNCTNVLIGWATGRFGLLVCPEVPSNLAFNYVGIVLSVLAGAVYVFVKTETKVDLPQCCKRTERKNSIDSVPDVQDLFFNDDQKTGNMNTADNSVIAVGVQERHSGSEVLVENTKSSPGNDDDEKEDVFLPNLSPMARRMLGIGLSLLSGCFYGIQFLPTTYIENHVVVDGVRASQDGLDYIFSTFCGIFMTSTAIFFGYMIINRKNAFINPAVVLPGIFAGVLWGIATCCWFLANSTLSQSISYPIIATAPGMIGALWGIFFLREIKGLRNFLVLAVAFSLTIGGAVLTALSK